MTEHPHAHEKRKRSLDEQLDGAALFSTVPGEYADHGTRTVYAEIEAPPSSVRVSRRTLTQDRAEGRAQQSFRGHAKRIVDRLRSIYPKGETRDELAIALDILLQSVCSCTNRLLKEATPPIYEGDTRGGKNVLYFYSHTHAEDSASAKE